MATYPLFGSTKLDPRVDLSPTDPPQLSLGDEVSRGVRRGLRSAGGSLAQLAGLGAEALEAPEVAKTAYGAARSLRESAAAPDLAPGVAQMEDVNSIGSGVRWVAGKAGELAPILGTALAGGALTANPLVGGTLAMAPFEMGDIAERQDQTLPVGDRLRNAALGGGASAVVGNVFPARLAGKFSGGLRGGFTSNVAEGAAVNAAGTAGSETIKQGAAGQELDPSAIGEAALAGGALGGVASVPVGIAGAVKGAGQKTADLAGKGIDLAKPVTDSVGKAALEGWQNMADLTRRAKEGIDTGVEDILQGRPIGEAAKDFATATGDRAKELWEMSNREKAQKVQEYGKNILDDVGFNEEKRAAVAEALGKTGDRMAEITVAGAEKARVAAKKAGGQLNKWIDALDKRLKGDSGSKKSEDYSGVEQAILQALRDSGIAKRRPELFDHADNVKQLGRAIRETMVGLNDGTLPDEAIRKMNAVLGDDTPSVLSAVHKLVRTNEDVGPLMKGLDRIEKEQQATSDLHKKLMALFTPEAKANYDAGAFNLAELDDAFVGDMQRQAGTGTSVGERAANFGTRSAYKTIFGTKADEAEKLLRKIADDRLPKVRAERPGEEKSSTETYGEEEVLDASGKPNEDVEEVLTFGKDTSRKDGSVRAKLGGDSYDGVSDLRYLKQHIEDLKVRYPKHDVYPITTFDNRLKESFTEIVVRKSIGRETDELTHQQHGRMFPDAKRDPGPARVKIGREVYDATHITRVGKEMSRFEDGTPGTVRSAESFFNGLSALAEKTGEIPELRDDLVIDYRSGQPYTYGEAKTARRLLSEDRLTPEERKAQELENTAIEYRKAQKARTLDNEGKKEHARIEREIRNGREFRVGREQADRNDYEEYVKAAQAANDALNAAKADDADLVTLRRQYQRASERREKARQRMDDAAYDAFVEAASGERGGIDPTGNIHRAAKKAGKKENEVETRSDVSGDKRYTDESVAKETNKRINEAKDTLELWERQVVSAPGKALVERAKTLVKNIHVMSDRDADQFFLAVREGVRPKDAVDTVNQLARKYASAIVAPETKPPVVSRATDEAAAPTKEGIRGAVKSAETLEKIKTNADVDGLRNMLKSLGSRNPARKAIEERLTELGAPPNPKEVAAKKAALVERAASGDPKLIDELRTTDDAKGLQRALEALPDGKARDAAMARMSELIKDDVVAYGLQTRKYSLLSTKIHEDLGNEGFAATHDSPHKFDGVFNWRKHKLKGEGVMAKGAGAYLSSADGIHMNYKEKFTAAVRRGSPEIRAMKDTLSMIEQDIYALSESLEQGALFEVSSYSKKFDTRKEAEEWIAQSGIVARIERNRAKLGKDGFDQRAVKDNIEYLENRLRTLGEEKVVDLFEKLGALEAEAAQFEKDIRKAEADLPRSPTYHVSVNIKPEELLDWDAKISGQSKIVRDAFDAARALLDSERANADNKRKKWLNQLDTLDDDAHGADLVHTLEGVFEDQAKASDWLQAHGVLGNVHNADGGRQTKYRNYVIFDDSKIKTNYVHFSDQTVDPKATGPVNRQAVEDHINKVLGGTVRTFWPQFTQMPWAGDYTHVQKLIRVSVHALNPMSVAHHESMHAFLAQLRDMGAHDVVQLVQKVAESPHMLKQLNEFLKNEPAALKQLKDPEERVAYMYQLWAAGQLKPAPAATTLFKKITSLVRRVLGMWTNDERALHIMEYFNSGEYAKNMNRPNAVHEALSKKGTNRVYEATKDLTEPLGRLADRLISMGSARVRETGVPALQDIADALKRESTDTSGKDQGFIQASRVAATKMRSEFADAMYGSKPEHLAEALQALQTGNAAKSSEARVIAFTTKKLLQKARDYMIAGGVDVGDLGKDYFPRVWDTAYIASHQKEFRDMMEPYVRAGKFTGSLDKLVNHIVARDGVEDFQETVIPGMQFLKKRQLDFISGSDAAPFLNKDLLHTVDSYLTQAARRTEWNRRLGNGKLERMLLRAKQEGATQEMLDTTHEYLQAVDGTLGDNIAPGLRRLQGNTIVYQNVRLLPLAVFSSVVDPLGVAVRGGTIGDAWNTFKLGIKEIPRGLRKPTGAKTGGEELAEMVGVIDNAMLSTIVSDLYTQGMVGGTAQKINNAFFKYNLMEGLNRSFRVGATQAAIKFLAKHADGAASRHSQRWMDELALSKGDIKVFGDRIALTEKEGLTAEQVYRVHAAINQWVDGAILRPDAADKPIWMNDPHYAVFAHLKQFIYSFQKTILERVVHEYKHGNYAPAMSLAMYVPVMIASDYIKGMIQGGGEQPDWKAGWGPADYIGYGVQRAGLLGLGQFGVDAYENMQHGGLGVTALGGPTVEQLTDVLGVLGGRERFGKVALDAMPANALYTEAMGPVHTH